MTIRDRLMRLLVSGDARLVHARLEEGGTVVLFDVWDTEISEELVAATFEGEHAATLREAHGGCVLGVEHGMTAEERSPSTSRARELWSLRVEVYLEGGGVRTLVVEVPGKLLRLDIVPKRVAVLRVAVCPDACPLLARDGCVAVLIKDLVHGEQYWVAEFVQNLGDIEREFSLDMVRTNFRGPGDRQPEHQACRLEDHHPLRTGCPLSSAGEPDEAPAG